MLQLYYSTTLLDAVNTQGMELYSVYVKDRFCDHGLVGAVGLYGVNIEICCLSCRVLGNGVEEKIQEFIKKKGGKLRGIV